MRFRYVPVKHFRTAGAHSEVISIHVLDPGKVIFGKDSYENEAQNYSEGKYEDEGEYTFELLAYGQKNNPNIVAELGPHNRTIWWDPNVQK